MTEDELIDSLPPHIRKQVIGALEVQAIEAGEIPDEKAHRKQVTRLQIALAWAWALPMTLIGLLLCLTLVLLPVGILVLFVAARPVAKLFQN